MTDAGTFTCSLGIAEDHLHRPCSRCGYEEAIATADSQ